MAYTRQSESLIADGLIIDPDALNAEFDAIVVDNADLRSLFTTAGTVTGSRTFQGAVLAESSLNYVATSTNATTGVISTTLSSSPVDYVAGMRFVTNVTPLPATGSTAMKFKINALAEKNIITSGGSNLVASQLTNGQLLEVIYDGTDFITYTYTQQDEVEELLRVWPPLQYVSTTSVQLIFPELVSRTNANGEKLSVLANTYSIDFSAAGAVNQLDTGSIAADSWYWIYAIKNTTSGDVQFMASLNTSAPTLPSGYTESYRTPFAVKTKAGAAEIQPFAMLNGKGHLECQWTSTRTDQVMFTNIDATEVTVDVSDYIPTSLTGTKAMILLQMRVRSDSGVGLNEGIIYSRTGDTDSVEQEVMYSSSNDNTIPSLTMYLPIKSDARTMRFRHNFSSASRINSGRALGFKYFHGD